jgi:hypothetical protein
MWATRCKSREEAAGERCGMDEAMVVVPPRTKHMTVIRRALA